MSRQQQRKKKKTDSFCPAGSEAAEDSPKDKLCQVFSGMVLARHNVHKLCQVFIGMVLANNIVENDSHYHFNFENDSHYRYHFRFENDYHYRYHFHYENDSQVPCVKKQSFS